MAQKLLTAKRAKIASKKDAAVESSIVIVGTYKEKQLAWIKKHGVYNYPVKDGDAFTLGSFAKIKELWLYADVKGRRHCFRAQIDKKMTQAEFLAAYPSYAKLGKPKQKEYYVFKTEFLKYGPALDNPVVVARVADFGGRAAKVKKAIEQFKRDGEFAPLSAYLPAELSKVPCQQLRVCEVHDEVLQMRVGDGISRREMIGSAVAGLACITLDPIALAQTIKLNQSHEKVMDDVSDSARSLSAVELFAGIGGFRLACDSLGIKTIWANDINENAVKVYRDRFGEDSVVLGDINNLIDQIPSHDILTGGFPCQPFSRAGKKMGVDDYRGTLFEAIVKVLKKNNPRYFVLENVNSLLFLDKGRNFKTILAALDELGYKIEWRVFNAAAFGLPQQRLRVIICGSREMKDAESYFVTKEEINAMPSKSREKVAQFGLWDDLVLIKGKFSQWGMVSAGKCVSYDFQPLRGIHKERILKDILQSDVPAEFDFTEDTLERIKKSLFVNKFYNGVRILYNQSGGARMGYTIFGIDGLSPTLTASSSRHYERYGIGDRFRRLTNVEYARLQGFPDDHCQAVSVYEQYRLYGNAVPPPLVAYTLSKIVKHETVRFESDELPLFK